MVYYYCKEDSSMANIMYHHKKSNGGIDYVGWNEQHKVYSRQYYANVGIMNAEESKHTTLKEVKRLLQWCIANGYKEVTYLPR